MANRKKARTEISKNSTYISSNNSTTNTDNNSNGAAAVAQSVKASFEQPTEVANPKVMGLNPGAG